jgi:tetratricopeptide (TPR) repeat protein
MWLMTQYGFYSVVAHRAEDDTFLVRSRVKNDLENLRTLAGLENEIHVSPYSTYPYRLVLSGEEWSVALACLGATISYDSFKKRIHALPDQSGRSEAYARVANLLAGLAEPSAEEVSHGDNGLRPGPPLQDDELETLYGEAVERGEQGDHEGALDVLEQLIEMAPQVPVGHWMKGVHLSALGRHEEAVWAFTAGLEIEPDDPHALWNMALACTRTGRHEAAILSLKHALKVDADFTDALLLLGHVYARDKVIAAPLDLDEWLAQHEPNSLNINDVNVVFLLALAYLALEDEDAARDQWEILRDMDYELAAALEERLAGPESGPPDDWEEQNDDFRAALERAARWAAQGGDVPPEATEMVYRSFMDGWLLVPLNEEPHEGESGGASLSLRSGPLAGLDNHVGLVAFTDHEAMERFFGAEATENTEHRVVLSGGDLCRALAQMAAQWTDSGHPPAALVINPGGPHPYALGLPNLVFLATGGVPLDAEHAVIGEGTNVEIRVPESDEERPPVALLSAVRDAIESSAAHTGAREVWWFLVRFGEGDAHLGLGVFPGDRETVDAVGRAINEVWWENAPSLAVYDVIGMEGDMDVRIRHSGEQLWTAEKMN